MKQISFVVPCYNSANYMRHCIDSLLIGGDDVEIIIIDDGSVDDTPRIADEYAKKYPNIVKVHHQKNGGHGEGVNQGLKIAKGRYFKVIDSDDWADLKSYKTLLKKIKKIDADVIIMNYRYTHPDASLDSTINFSNVFPQDKEVTWKDTKHFRVTQFLSLHSMMYKKTVLDASHIALPKHTFYEDNLFIYLPLINTKTIYYMDMDFYKYFIGRDDQSVQEPQLIKRSAQQVLIAELVCKAYDLDEVKKTDKKLYKIMRRECSLLVALGVVFSRLSETDDGEKQYKDMWDTIKNDNPKLFKYLRYHSTLASWASLPGKVGRAIVIGGYRGAHFLVKFN